MCLVKILECVVQNGIVKFSNQGFSYKLIAAAMLDQKSDIVLVLIHFYEPSYKWHRKR